MSHGESVERWELLSATGAWQPEELVDVLKTGRGWRIERIVSHGHMAPADPDAWYDQDDDEWVMVVSGAAKLAFTDPEDEVELFPGDAVWLPAHRKHRVAWTDPDRPTVWLAVFLEAGEREN